MAFDSAVINFAVYENSKEYIGTASATMPDISLLTASHSGAGIAGNIEDVILGHVDTMTLGLSFKTLNENAFKLCETRYHDIDLRVAQQEEDPVSGTIKVRSVKHIMRVIPKKTGGGGVAPASAADVSGEYAVRYWKTTIDGTKVLEIDPLNFICYINGSDVLAEVKAALGK